ncbi:MAG TPA: lytic transglycosylase domain-containing protein [Streptosporangiaceae bacterium]|nr:lytic transglycosylase domain-containing protein [Streptosporangiaceae bacterium]
MGEPRTARPGALTRATFPSCGPPPFLGPGPYGAKQVARRADRGRAVERRVTLSRDRRIITRKRSKLTVVAAAGALSVAAAATAPSASASLSASPSARTSASPSASPTSSPSPSPAPAANGSPQSIAQSMLKSFGWSSSQFSCLEPLWEHESGWNPSAANPSTGAYGIPQASPGSKMASAGPDWKTNASTQIKWGLGYIKDTYGSPCAAWSHEQADGWY